jgi:hypothetical protein
MSALDLSPRARTAFVAAFLAGQAVLIATAGGRSDRSYGFRMFPETSAIVVHVSRRLDDGREVPIVGGRWEARDCSGAARTFQWNKMIRPPGPARLDVPIGAPYGVDSGIERTRDALRWVAERSGDCETRAFVAKVELKKNGVASGSIDLEAARVR